MFPGTVMVVTGLPSGPQPVVPLFVLTATIAPRSVHVPVVSLVEVTVIPVAVVQSARNDVRAQSAVGIGCRTAPTLRPIEADGQPPRGVGTAPPPETSAVRVLLLHPEDDAVGLRCVRRGTG